MLSRGKILIVDDEPLVLDMFQSFFERQDFDVYVASNAKEAYDLASLHEFSVVFCDVVLGAMNGLDLLARLKKTLHNAQCILVTGSPNPDDLARAQELNASYLSKPVTFDRIIETLHNTNGSLRSPEPTISRSNH